MADYALIGDIGGTNARFALTDLTAPQPRFEQEQTLGDGEFGSLQDAARHYLDVTGARPRRAPLAVASPIEGDAITLTNRNWSFRRRELQGALQLDDLRLINDFAAIAWAAPHLAAGDRDERVHVDDAVRAAIAVINDMHLTIDDVDVEQV